jgi:hypothetical protein
MLSLLVCDKSTYFLSIIFVLQAFTLTLTFEFYLDWSLNNNCLISDTGFNHKLLHCPCIFFSSIWASISPSLELYILKISFSQPWLWFFVHSSFKHFVDILWMTIVSDISFKKPFKIIYQWNKNSKYRQIITQTFLLWNDALFHTGGVKHNIFHQVK